MTSYTTSPPNAIEHLSMDLHRRRQWAELSVLRILASSPKWLRGIAADEDLTAADFADEDTHIIAAALLEPGGWTTMARLRAAKARLQQAHLWDDDAPAFNPDAMRWSDTRLAGLAVGMGAHATEGLFRTAIAGLRLVQSALLNLERRQTGRAAA